MNHWHLRLRELQQVIDKNLFEKYLILTQPIIYILTDNNQFINQTYESMGSSATGASPTLKNDQNSDGNTNVSAFTLPSSSPKKSYVPESSSSST